jgi:hypothetical protein
MDEGDVTRAREWKILRNYILNDYTAHLLLYWYSNELGYSWPDIWVGQGK